MSDEYVGVVHTKPADPKIGDMIMRGADGSWTTLPLATPSGVADLVLTIDPDTGLPFWKES